MHTTDQMNRFIELRSQGLSVPTISMQIGIPASTLYDWNDRARDHIERIKRIMLEEIETHVLGSHEHQLETLARVLKIIDNQIVTQATRCIHRHELPTLIGMAASLRRQLHGLRTGAVSAGPPAAAQSAPLTPPSGGDAGTPSPCPVTPKP